jgi:hypothetical protein
MTRTTCPDMPGRSIRRRADGQQPPLGAVRPASGQGRFTSGANVEPAVVKVGFSRRAERQRPRFSFVCSASAVKARP